MAVALVDINKFDFLTVLDEQGRDYDKAVAFLVEKYRLGMPRNTIEEITLGVHLAYIRTFLWFGTNMIDYSLGIESQRNGQDYGQQHRALEYIKAHNTVAYRAIETPTPNETLNQRIALVLARDYPELLPGVGKSMVIASSNS